MEVPDAPSYLDSEVPNFLAGDGGGCYMDLLMAADPSIAQTNLDSSTPLPVVRSPPIEPYEDYLPHLDVEEETNLDSSTAIAIPVVRSPPIEPYEEYFPPVDVEEDTIQIQEECPNNEEDTVDCESINESIEGCDESLGCPGTNSCTISSFSCTIDKQTEDDASSKSHCYRKMNPDGLSTLMGEKRIPNLMEQSIRAYTKDKTVTLFKPELGMVFGSAGDAFQFYNLYSWVRGFSIRSGGSYTNTRKVRTMQEFKCGHEGKPKDHKNSTTRCGCKARLRVLMSADLLWYVKIFVEEHNHALIESCGQKKHLFSHRHIDDATKTMVRHLRENNVTLSRINGIVGSLYGNTDSVPFTKKALRTLCSDIASEALQHDVRKTIEAFRDMIAQDKRFLFTVELDENDALKSLMWTSGPSRALYSHFGDAVTFDTTYETNIYKMPFGMFVGVNNHFQSVIFAGVMLTNEKAENFDWAFRQFVAMMGGKAPLTMLTDQSQAMTIAVGRTLKKTKHRWCKWHVLRRCQELLGHVYKDHPSFGDDFNKAVNHMLTIDEFERAWDSLIDQYDLRADPFMTRVFECRKKWAKPYFQDTFCARMSSTQRSESANHVLKVYIPPQSSLNVFVKQYTKLIDQREKDDHEAEKNTREKTIKLTVRYPIEGHAAKIYTINVYKLFLQELLKSTSYVVNVITEGELYEVCHVQPSSREAWARVNFTIEITCGGGFYKCQCGLYPHFGIICCHIIRVLLHRGIGVIPEMHIMKRWTRDARSDVPSHLVSPELDKSNLLTREFRHNMIHISTIDIPSLGDVDNESMDIVMRNVERMKKELATHRAKLSTTCQVGYGFSRSTDNSMSGQTSGQHDGSDGESSSLHIYDPKRNKTINVESIKAPNIIRKAGRNHNSRYKSRLEGIIRKTKPLAAVQEVCNQPGGRTGVHQTRFCSWCRESGHDIRGCKTKAEGGEKVGKKRKTYDKPATAL